MRKKLNYICTLGLMICTLAGFSQMLTPEQVDTCKVFQDLDKALEYPGKVYRLDLTRQRLKSFPEEVLQLPYLHELILDRNKIDSIPASIKKLTYLQHFSIQRNDLMELPEEICTLTNLRILNVGENYLEELPEDLGRLKELRELILWSNMIGELPFSMTDIPHLKRVDMLHNEMNAEEQRLIRDMLPDTEIEMSAPCMCNFDDD